MLAIDTNVIVRFLTGDHPQQSRKAKALIERSDVFVSLTVLLECEWVLRSVYGFAAAQVASALRAFAGLSRVAIEQPDRLDKALDWMENGMDFADALHLANAAACDAFVSFDRRLVKSAARRSAIKVRAL